MTESKRVYRCDKITMEVVEIYRNTTDAQTGTEETHISGDCKARIVSKGRYVWRYEDDYDPNESFEGKRNRPVICGDYKKGRIFFFSSINVTSKALGLPKTTIFYAIKRNSKVENRYRFKYAR